MVNIVIIDDDSIQTKTMSSHFTSLGAKVTSFSNGEAFLHSISNDCDKRVLHWDIIVMNCIMSPLSGIQTLMQMANIVTMECLFLCMVTGSSAAHDNNTNRENEFLDKWNIQTYIKGGNTCKDIYTAYKESSVSNASILPLWFGSLGNRVNSDICDTLELPPRSRRSCVYVINPYEREVLTSLQF